MQVIDKAITPDGIEIELRDLSFGWLQKFEAAVWNRKIYC